jgi:osmotically-inducible protein OsmY
MRTKRSWSRGAVCGVVLALCGCSGDDVDRLSRIGRKVAEKCEGVLGGAKGYFAGSGNSTNEPEDTSRLVHRVQMRLRYEKDLKGLSFEVENDAGAITLKGTVRNAEQRQRAVQLTRSTVGVSRVQDELTVENE